MYAAYIMLMRKLQIQQEQRFHDHLKSLPHELQNQLIKDRASNQEKARQEATAERRHRELCDAIKYRR